MPVYDETATPDVKALNMFLEYERALSYCKEKGLKARKGFKALQEEGSYPNITFKGLRARLDPAGVKNGFCGGAVEPAIT